MGKFQEGGKNMNKKLFLGIGIAVLCIATALAYNAWTLLNTTQEINVVEGVEMQYWNGVNWVDVPMNSGTVQLLPEITLKPGEATSTPIRMRNTAQYGNALNLNFQFSFEDYVTTHIECNVDNRDGAVFSYVGNSMDMLLNANSGWKTVDIIQELDGSASLTVQIVEGNVSRSNALNDYAVTCEVPV